MQELVRELERLGALSSKRVRDAFLAVDRAAFVPAGLRAEAYGNYPLPIGADQTISQPLTVALMLEELSVGPGMRVLDVGSGSGWSTALLAHLVGSDGEVFAVERVPELVALGRENLSSFGVEVSVVDAGGVLGVPSKAPFDRVLVSAAADEVPAALVNQLVVGGLMVLPVRDSLVTVRREEEGYSVVGRREGFRFVPLVSG